MDSGVLKAIMHGWANVAAFTGPALGYVYSVTMSPRTWRVLPSAIGKTLKSWSKMPRSLGPSFPICPPSVASKTLRAGVMQSSARSVLHSRAAMGCSIQQTAKLMHGVRRQRCCAPCQQGRLRPRRRGRDTGNTWYLSQFLQQFHSIFTGFCPDFSGHSSFLCNVYKLLCQTLCLLSITKDGLFVYTSIISA